MFLGLTLLDWILVAVLLMFLVNGYRRGMWVTLGRTLGFVVGGLAAFFLIPWIVSLLPSRGWRLVAIGATMLILVALGMMIGAGIGRAVRLRVSQPALRRLDRMFGAVVNTAVAAVMIGILGFAVSSMGSPLLTSTLKQSRVIGTITDLTPDSAQSTLAQWRSDLVASGRLPELTLPIISPSPPAQPSTVPPDAAIVVSSESVVRIAGTALECGQNQTGSGFAVEPDRVVTNAHVVAGVDHPTVETMGGDVHVGDVVYFDAASDLAVIALEGADLPDLDVGSPLEIDDGAYVLGYPSGGPFRITPAHVQAHGPTTVNNIYGAEPHLMDVYQLHADVRQGNSGGPLVDVHGDVVGVIFARAAGDVTVGYAVTAEEAQTVLTEAATLTNTVPTGQCVP